MLFTTALLKIVKRHIFWKFKVEYNKFHQNLIPNVFELLFESVMTNNYGIYSFQNQLSFNHYSNLETVTAPMKFKFWD